ncbi:MAG: beta-lactamase family protein [Treponema sp.]|nr:beta-lactamase family protein [Treponema sp.]
MDIAHLQLVQNAMDSAVKANKIAGLNLMVFKDDCQLGYWQSGFADVEAKRPFTKDTICRMFSMTKTITSVASMILLEEGKIDLHEEVYRYIPAFKNLKISTGKGRDSEIRNASRPLLIQDLLNMTSGYTYGAWWDGAPAGEHLTSDLINELNKDITGANRITTREVADRLAEIPVSFEPGTAYAYGLSADIMGALIEVVTGMKYSDFLKKRILNPLGMTDTDFYVPAEKQARLAKAYSSVEDENGRHLELFTGPNLGISNDMSRAPAFESGGAGLCSTVEDYMKFTSMLTNGGQLNGKRILHKKTLDFLANSRLRADLQESFNRNMEHLSGYTYCNFMRVAFEPGHCKAMTELGEMGWDGWLGPYLSVDMKNGLSIVMTMQMTNAGTTDTTRKIKNIIYSSLT